MALHIEKSLRLATFREDCPVVLGNGETFHLRPMRMVRAPHFDDDGNCTTDVVCNMGEEYLERLGKIFEKLERKDAAEQESIIEDVYWCADKMLLRNYRPEIRKHYAKLFGVTTREPDSQIRFGDLFALVLGRDPKGLTPNGSARL